MKITTNDGLVFEGTQAEYEAFLAFAERKLVEQEADVSAAEVEESDVSKPKLKAGDFVKITRKMSHYDNDKVYEVIDSGTSLCVIDEDGDFNCGAINDGEYEILSTEEVAKHADEAKWAKIDRKVGEIKVGDLVVITEYCCGASVGEIVKVSKTREQSDGNTRIYYDHHESFSGYTAHYGSYTLIAPVESTLN